MIEQRLDEIIMQLVHITQYPKRYLIEEEETEASAVRNLVAGALAVDVSGALDTMRQGSARWAILSERGWPTAIDAFWEAMREKGMDQHSLVQEAIGVEIEALRRMQRDQLGPLIGVLERVRRQPFMFVVAHTDEPWIPPINFHEGFVRALQAYQSEEKNNDHNPAFASVRMKYGWPMDNQYSPWKNMADQGWNAHSILKHAIRLEIEALKRLYDDTELV